MLKQQLALLQKEFTTLKSKITTKLQTQQKTIRETTTKLNESNHQLELVSKETKLLEAQNSENEKVLETLLKEFKELGEKLEK
jgi:hypothetical protein